MSPITDLYCQLHPLKLDAVKAQGLAVMTNTFSILCLTTDPVHQGHERRKKKKSTAQHVGAATRSIKCERQ